MGASPVRVGFPVSGTPTSTQRAAVEWADERYDAEAVPLDSLTEPTETYDLLWWHRDEPLDGSDLRETVAPLRAAVRDGGRLVLGLRGMAAVEALDVDPVPPDATGVDPLSEPTGPLWKAVHADHPAVASFDDLRIPVADGGSVPYARYDDVIPANGEVLASTVEGRRDRPQRTSVVAWYPGDGVVLGVAAPLLFDASGSDRFRDARDQFAAGVVDSVIGRPDRRYARPDGGSDLERLRGRLAGDDHRPSYHVTPPANWLNDPNGLVRYDGRYHLFYQYNPAGPHHATIHWGHAVSDDLVHWEDEPVALTPSPDGPDRDGCWSGCTVVDDGTPTAVYTGGRGRDQLPCLATSDDTGLRTWQKHDGNPVIESTPDEPDLLETDHWRTEFRDHCLWRENGRWYHIIGSGVTDVGGTALLYTGETLTDWTYEGPILVGDREDAGPVWECPELLRFDRGDLLHVSNYETVRYFLGAFNGDEFDVSRRGILDHGDFYAPQSLRDGDRYLTWGWLPEAREFEAQWDAGWSGALSLPRVLDLAPDGRLRQRPAPELTALRGTRDLADETLALSAGDRRSLDTGGRQLELEATVALDDADAVELSVFESPDREEMTVLRYASDDTLRVERDRSSLDSRATTDVQSMDVPPVDEPLSLRVFLDGSVVELFANERHCLTSRVYPTREDSTGVSLSCHGGRATVSDLSAWQLGSAWPSVPDDRTLPVGRGNRQPDSPDATSTRR